MGIAELSMAIALDPLTSDNCLELFHKWQLPRLAHGPLALAEAQRLPEPLEEWCVAATCPGEVDEVHILVVAEAVEHCDAGDRHHLVAQAQPLRHCANGCGHLHYLQGSWLRRGSWIRELREGSKLRGRGAAMGSEVCAELRAELRT